MIKETVVQAEKTFGETITMGPGTYKTSFESIWRDPKARDFPDANIKAIED